MKKIKNIRFKQTFIWIALILCIWEFVSKAGVVNIYILPPFSQVFKQMIMEFTKGNLLFQLINSLYIVLIGFLISFLIALIVTLICVYSKTFESFFMTLCTLCNPLPGMAILPLIMMWFGVGNGAMLALIVHGVLWPLVTNMLTGFQNIPSVYKEWAYNIGMKPYQIFWDIYVFSIMPHVISGLRIGWGRAWRALISAEMVFGMIGSLGGIGYYIYVNRAYANVTNVLVGILTIIIIGVLVETILFRTIEKHTVDKWGNRL